MLARIVGNALGRVRQAQGRRRYHRLLDRHVRVPHGDVQVTAGVPPVSEGAAREPREPPRVAVGERNGETIRGRVRKTVHAVRREVVVLPLFAVRDYRRARRLEPLDGVPNGVFIERSQIGLLVGIRGIAPRDPLDQFRRSGNAANGLGGYGGWGGHSHCSDRLAWIGPMIHLRPKPLRLRPRALASLSPNTHGARRRTPARAAPAR